MSLGFPTLVLMTKLLFIVLSIGLFSACESTEHAAPQLLAAASDTGESASIKAPPQGDPDLHGEALNTLPVFGSASQNQYGAIYATDIKEPRLCAVKLGTKPNCDDLTRCASVANGTARIEYLEVQMHLVFTCDSDGQPGDSQEILVKAGELTAVSL